MEGELAEIPPSRLGNDMHEYLGEISPEKLGQNIFNVSSGKEEETRHLDKDRKNVTEPKTEPRRFYEQEAEAQNMSPPPTYNPQLPTTKQIFRKPGDGSNARLHMPIATYSAAACTNQ